MAREKSKSTVMVLFLGVLIGLFIYISTSSTFEKDVPTVSIKNNNGYWNLKSPLELSLSDESGIKTYKVIFKGSKGESTLHHEQLITPEQNVELKIEAPKNAFALDEEAVTISVEVTDASKWNFFKGNSVSHQFTIQIDKRRPNVSILGNSYSINKGGSALVIFKATDENLKEIYIETNANNRFIAQPFYKDGYYISLMAWPITLDTFDATIVVTDHADNIKKTHIPLYLKTKKYRVSEIKITDDFLQGKIADLAEEFEETQGVTDPIEQFKIINEKVRFKNEKVIHDLASVVSKDSIDSFKITPMYPLKNGKVVASFGDYRKYFYNGNQISYSYHLGLDFASNAMAVIKPQNGGKVVHADYNGLYGNMPMIDHGLGLYTIYGHCSSINVSNGDVISPNTELAHTGTSGYAMGDHLHFGVLVQGVEVRPEEWMDKQWIQLNIYDIIQEAKKIINKS